MCFKYGPSRVSTFRRREMSAAAARIGSGDRLDGERSAFTSHARFFCHLVALSLVPGSSSDTLTYRLREGNRRSVSAASC